MAAGSAIRAGRAFVELFLDETKLQSGLKSAQARLQTFGKSITSIGAKTFAFGASLAGAFVPTIQAASDFEETFSKFNTVFGDNAAAVQQWANEFGKQIGRSQTQVLGFLAGTQDLLVPLGFEPGAAEEMSKQLTQLAVDLGSFNNMADEDVLRDLHAALTGSGEVMKKYGVLVSEAAVKQELFNQGLDPKAATDQQKVMARLSIIMQGTTAAQGDALRTADSFANSMKRLKAQIADAAVTIGQELLPVITPLIKRAAEFVQNTLVPWIQRNRLLIPDLAELAVKIAAGGLALSAFGKVMTTTASTIGTFSKVMQAARAGTAGFKAGMAGLAVAGVFLAHSIGKSIFGVNEFNRQLRESVRLTGELNDRESRRQQNFLADVAVLQTPSEKRGAIAAEADLAQKNIRGLEERTKAAQKEFDRLNTTFKGATGNKLLEAAKTDLEETAAQLEAARNWALDLQDALKDVDREAKLSAAIATPPEIAAIPQQIAAMSAAVPGADSSNPVVIGPGGARTTERAGSRLEDKMDELIREVRDFKRTIEQQLAFN